MRVSRQSNLPARLSSAAVPLRPFRRGSSRAAFTLVELILVLLLLAITATLVGTNMGSFFRGRALNFEARRMLSLSHYAQTRAVSEGVPVVLWINVASSTYGLTIQSSYGNGDGDPRAVSYTVDPNLRLETPDGIVESLSENQDERLGLPDDTVAIRFMPDGFFDESSVRRIIIRQGNEGALELVPAANRLSYEVRPASTNG
jgi:Tfp pilus assembly protein FimT